MPEMAGKPIEELSETEKNTPSEMYPDENTAEHGEADPEKQASEETPESKTEAPEEELKEGEEKQSEVQEQAKDESPAPTPKSSDNAEEREIQGLEAQQERLKQQILDNIVSMRAQKRQQVVEPPQPVSQPEDVEGIDPEIAKQLDNWATKKGLAPEAQIREKIQRENLVQGLNAKDKEFFGKYPEYLYSQELRNEHEGIVSTLKEASSPEEYQQNLDLAHSIIKQKHPDRFPSSSGADTTKKQALKTASLGTSGQSAPSSNQPAVDPAKVAMARRFYKGFTEEEIMRYARNLK